MKCLFEEMKRLLAAEEDLVLVTVIAGSGSTPRGAGARMIVRKDGSSMGTIGGGAVEYRCSQMAADVLKEKISYSRGFKLVKGQAADLGMICGGDVVVYFQYISPDNQAFTALCDMVLAALERDEDSWIITDITDETAWSMGTASESMGVQGMELSGENQALFQTRAIQVEVGVRKYYSEPLVSAGTVYVFGGGHVAQELVPVLAHVGFRCIVYDDRPEFSNKHLFPQAEGTIVASFEDVFQQIEIEERDYVVIMTRGHQCDYEIQKWALKTKAHYIGVMGSGKKLKTLNERLIGEGFTRKDVERFYGPIGLPIQAETPAEIAISVAAELISVRAGRA